MSYHNIREEELKNKVSQDYFIDFDTTKIIGNIDFCISNVPPSPLDRGSLETSSLLWAEAKKGKSDIYLSFVQLILTIGKARTFAKYLPPAFLGAFDAEQIAFIAYNQIQEIFYLNDFNWNVTPSNHETKEFKLIFEKVKTILENNSLLFKFDDDELEIKEFIKTNFVIGTSETSKIQIDKNNFIIIYTKWLAMVKPTIILDWDRAKKSNIIDGDFYLADLLSSENQTLKEKLFVILKQDRYELDRKLDEMGFLGSKTTGFNDNQKAHKQFWNKYTRPPKEEYWDYIVERRDLLVPQDVRERKGSFFTPQIWVELSQKYLTDELGENWQDEYYIWDCAAGTGNLLAGLTNKYNIYASTLDQQDVDVMKDRIKNGANLLESHVFQFDFLNDDFNDKKVPESLKKILQDEEKRKKLLIYINPPYAEASNKKTLKQGIEGNRAVEQSYINQKYSKHLGQGNAELFVQFFTRIYFEIPDCKLASFSTLKYINGPHFLNFRSFFKAKFYRGFIMPADTFDNVKGQFPIGFMLWDLSAKEEIKKIKCDIYLSKGEKQDPKTFYSYHNKKYMNDWIKPFRADPAKNQLIGKFPFKGNDFQNQNMIQIVHQKMDYNVEAGQFLINQKNVMYACVYFAIKKCIPANWINDRDQFLYPKKKWETDAELKNNCLAYTLFSNKIQSKYGTNHWIPFTEKEVNARDKFESNFMTNFIKNPCPTDIPLKGEQLEITESPPSKWAGGFNQKPLVFSDCAKALFEAGKKLYTYYHAQSNCNVNASLYDIKEYFQGRNEKGNMNSKSQDEKYTELIVNLRESLNNLAEKIQPKVYEYGFLLE